MIMRIPHRKLFTKRQLARLDAYWWAASFAAIRVMREGIREPSKWTSDSWALCPILDEFDEAMSWFAEMRRDGHGS